MSRTVVVPTGDDLEYYLAVTVDEAAMVRAVRAVNPAVALANTVTPSESLRRAELDGHCAVLARDVAVLSILTGRNLRQDLVIPWGGVSEGGQPINSPTWADRGYGELIPNHPDLFSFLEDSEYDPEPGFVRDDIARRTYREVPVTTSGFTSGFTLPNTINWTPPAEPRLQWRCWGLMAGAYWNGEEFDTEDCDDAEVFHRSASELSAVERRLDLKPCAWELVEAI